MKSDRPIVPTPLVHTAQHTRTLRFSYSAIQSRMDLRHPDALNLDYTRLMMGFLLLCANPPRIAMIGLGGGSLAKFCHRYLPATDITVVEISAAVIATREVFRVPAESERFRVLQADGAAFIAEQSAAFEVLLVDGYDQHGLAPSLGSDVFYRACANALVGGGVLVVNLNLDEGHSAQQLDAIQRSFLQQGFAVTGTGKANRVVFAQKSEAATSIALPLRRPDGFDAEAWQMLRRALSRVQQAARAAG